MKCVGTKKDGSPCDYTSEEAFHFCPSCGGSSDSGQLARPPEKEISCPGNGDGPCGKQIKEKFKFCPECGWKVDKSLFAKPTMKCPECHTDYPEGSKFCSECGCRLTSRDSVKHDQPSKLTEQGAGDARFDKNANVSGSPHAFAVQHPPPGILDTSPTLVAPVIQQESSQIPFIDTTVSDSPSVTTAGTLVVVEQPGNVNPCQTRDLATTMSQVTLESNLTPVTSTTVNQKLTTGTSANVSYVTVVSGQTSIKRSSSEELTNEAKRTRASPEHSGEHGGQDDIMDVKNDPKSATINVAIGSSGITGKSAATVHVNMDKPTVPVGNMSKDSGQGGNTGEKKDKSTEPGIASGAQADVDLSKKPKSVKESSSVSETQPSKTNDAKQENLGKGKSGNDKEGQTKLAPAISQTKNTYSSVVSGGKQKGGGGQGKQGTKGRQAAKQTTTGNEVQVVFHALISEQWNLDKKREDVFIRFGPDVLGGFSQSRWKMTDTRKSLEGALEYICEVTMPKELRSKGFKYKYVVHRHDNKLLWEEPYFRQRAYHGNSLVNRSFDLPNSRKQFQGTWHQYDGFVYPKVEKGFWERVKGFLRGTLGDQIQHDVSIAAETFMPKTDEITNCLAKDIPLDSHTAEDMLERVFMVYSGLSLQMLDKSLKDIDDGVRDKVFLKFFKPLQDYLLMLVENTTPNATETSGLVLASFLLLVAWENDMSHHLQRDHRLLRAFLPHPDFEKKTCPDVEAVKTHFKTKATKDLVNYLRHSINSHAQAYSYTGSTYPCESQWLYLVPLLHFLRKDSEPFKRGYDTETTNRKWWGHEGIDDPKDTLKRIYQWSIPVSHLTADLQHLFEVDYLLPRTLMACVSRYHLMRESTFLSLIPPEVSSATFFFHLKSQTSQIKEEEKKEIALALNAVADTYRRQWMNITEGQVSERTLDEHVAQAKQGMMTALEVFLICLRSTYEVHELIAAAGNLFLASLWDGKLVYKEVKLCPNLQNELTKCVEYLHSKLNYAQHRILEWMEKRFHYHTSLFYVKLSLKLWDALICAPASPAFQKEWTHTLLDAFERILCKMQPQDCLDLHYEDVSLSDMLRDRMTNAAFSSFETLALKDDKFTLTTNMTVKFGKLMSQLLERHWPHNEEHDIHALLKFVLSWNPLKRYFERFYGISNSSELLSTQCIDHLTNAASLLDSLKNNVSDGSIPLSHLRMILKDSEHFFELWSAAETNFSNVDKARATDIELLKLSLQARKQELDACEQCVQRVQVLLNMSVYIDKVDSNSLYERAREVDGILVKGCITDVCFPIHLQKCPVSLDKYTPKLRLFDISEEVMQIVPQLEQWKSSMIFHKLWERESKAIEGGTELGAAILGVWNKVKSAWLSLCAKFADGSATFKVVQKHVNMFQRDNTKIRKEFKLMSDNTGSSAWIEERIMQLECYEVLQGCQKAAHIIMEIRDIYGITGDFSPVEAIQVLGESSDKPMKTMNASVLKTCETLEGLNDPGKQECITAFKDSKPLVDWLRESMTDGLKELKVFVELAFISAGEEPMEIHKVNCFHSATTGYAPLIFNTPQNCDHATFLNNCDLVWLELKSDKKLPEKLIDTKRHLRWLQEVKQSHGSVEVTALTQAGMINTKGLYRIGNLEQLDTVSDMTLNKVISLHVSQDITEENPARKYNYDQLVDLQSRLMLVAGQAEMGKENVDLFIMVLDGVVRLAKTYIRLCSDGCVLFNCWKGKFLCGEERRACSFLEFGHGENHETLKGHRGEEGVDTFIISLANQFEKFHEEWLKYVSDKRDEYLELNFYTIDQLVFLQRELIKLGTEEEPSVRIYPMLSLIKPNCTQADLTNAMQMAKDIVFAKEEEAEEEMEVNEPLQTDDPNQAFIDAMLDSNFSERLAKLALEANDPDDIDSGIVWCMEHQDDFKDTEEEVVRESSVDQTQPMFSGWQVGEESVSSSAVSWVRSISAGNKNTTVKDLICNLESVWTKFLDAVSSSVADYLSLEHLGIILRQLAQAGQQTFSRTIPPPLKPEIPNLIVCPQVDMLNAVLHIYKHTDDEPLPQPDEVLLCTPQTTFDQVDIFLRRAFFSNPGKVYTLANADYLQYEIEERTEKKLKEYANKTEGLTYQLVILCSTENEFKARIVAALERNRCPPPSLQNLEEIRQYLQTKFSQKCITGGEQSASHLDFDSTTVRVVKSTRAGVGKTLYKKRQVEALQRLNPRIPATSVTIHLYKKTVSTADVAEKLLDHTLPQGKILPRIFHLDISYEVQEGVDYLLFNLLVLGCISNNMGHVWLRSPLDLYLVETIPITDARHERRVGQRLIHPLLEVLPDVYCWSPQDSLQILTTDNKPEEFSRNDRLFDDIEFQSQVYQRPYQYLKRWSTKASLAGINPTQPEGSHQECLNVLLQHCGVRDPAWSELHNFVWFLNTQLVDFEKSIFCSDLILEDLPGFPVLVLHFLIQMSRDFATRSLVMSEQSPLDQLNIQDADEDLEQFQMKRTWESSPHPYIFFNPDGHTMTFLGFNIDRQSGNMVDQQTGQVLERGLVPKPLQDGLIRNRVNINENFDQMQRLQRLEKLCNVMPGVDYVHDPDETYELTTDNVKKILAIYMRFRCGIPVIIMGETGCGKTRLVKFMCALQCPPGSNIENMVIMKVHGGTTSEDIIRKVQHAERLAAANKAKNNHMYTVLFFDEANTTESIGLIKEIMCDGAMDGQPLRLSENLKIVAACNPYRKHSDELIKRLEKAGLGYHVDADKTTDKLGRVPMRRLVYRVQPLPQSMLPLVWDFGQLNTQVEELYIKQMVNRYVRNGQIPSLQNLVNIVSKILIASQDFMRKQADECSFVSLRDVERTLSVMAWFYQQSQEYGTLFNIIDDDLLPDQDPEAEEEEEDTSHVDVPDDVTKALILALSVCYRASLRSRDDYDRHIIRYFNDPCRIPGGIEQMAQVINSCQSGFVDQVQLEDNIAKNLALKENLFMMVVCIELRIPLFLVGKPGSSKSLAKTIVADAMQGNSARTDLFKQLKQVQMVSFQCSPLATAEGIVGTFRQCARYQQDKDLDRFVSIVVLDEVGLAEDSPRMPLKTLHPLLEDGCQGDEKSEPFKKVAFIGISNWALDPAKMNRGILVQREAPDDMELVESAQGICSSNPMVLSRIKPLLPQLADAYKTIFYRSQETKREFFGLRDYYSLVKMVYAFADTRDRDICWHQLDHAILRNFGGLDNLNPVVVFRDKITTLNKQEERHEDDPDSTTIGLIEAGLFGDGTSSESRYLLLLTENYGALGILQQQILKNHKVITIFGSSFPKDQEYTQICRNINRIKVCMETGNTVILLNLESLYESLYDALNQYYARLGGERFVDLGLGTHRVKCRVHQKFRLIVVAEKQKVYEEFPIPLINRLEKHFLTLNNMMTEEQIQLSKRVGKWAVDFATPRNPSPGRKPAVGLPGDAFMGYHPDTPAAIVLQVLGRTDRILAIEDDMFKECQQTLLWCATPASVVRLTDTKLYLEANDIHTCYFRDQKHGDIFQYLTRRLIDEQHDKLQAQITTHSKLLTDQEKEDLARNLNVTSNNIILLTLQSFDTEQQFAQQIKNFVQRSGDGQKLLLIQCGSGDRNQSLIKSAQYCVLDELPDEGLFAVVFIIQLPNIAGGCFSGFQAGKWHSLHLDELRPPASDMPSMEQLNQNAPSDILEGIRGNKPPASVQELEKHIEPMDYDEDLMGTESLPYLENKNTAPTAMRMEQTYSEGELMEVEDSEIVNQRTEVLGIDDIVLEEEQQMMSETDTVAPYFQHLLLPCIQSAAALIKDEELDTRRSTKRIEILLSLLDSKQDKDAQMFMSGLSRLIISLLREKEEKQQTGSLPTNWLSKEAAKPENVRKAGTFRRAAMQCLENKITPILAGVVAFLDTNRNLDFMCLLDKEPWTRRLWLELVKNTRMCHHQCKSIIAPGNQYHHGEVVPHHFGISQSVFSVQTPFFWLLYQVIGHAITQADNTNEVYGEDSGALEYIANIISKTDYGRVLLSVVEDRDKPNMILAYLGDFVNTVYHGKKDEELKILCDSLMSAARQNERDLFSLNLSQALVYIHIIHSEAKERLHLFLEVEQIWPEVVHAVTEFKSSVAGNPLLTDTEMTLDVLSVMLLLEQLEPKKDQLNTDDGRATWMDLVKTYLPVIERILNTTESDLTHGPVCCRSMDQARCGWMRVMTMKLFLESFTGNKKIQLETRCMPLWKMLGEETDLTKIDSLEKVERFLKIVNKSVVKKLSGKVGRCNNCETEFEAPAVELPCKDLICLRCFNDIQATKELSCPKCQKNIPKKFKPGSGASKEKECFQEYEALLKCCNNFLMSVVSKLCFGGIRTPDSAVIERIFSYITRKVDAGLHCGRLYTKEMSVFDDMIDPTPVVRSFLLQLLIHKSEETVQKYLQDFFHQAKSLCQQGREETSKDTIEEIVQFSLLVIHCFEDLYHERGSSSYTTAEEMRDACHQLSSGRKYLLSLDLDMEKMFTIAQCRYGLSVAAKYLHAVLVAKDEKSTLHFRELLNKTSDLLDVQNTDWPKKFLVKQICREFGTDSYHTICESSVAPWLALDQTDQVKECPDRYVVCLEYQKVREALAKTLLGEDIKYLKSLVKESELLFLLAIHREVTMKNIKNPTERGAELQAMSMQEVEKFIETTKEKVTQKELAMRLLKNAFGRQGSHLNIQPHQSVRYQSLVCLLVHASLALTHFNNTPEFLKPLTDLIQQPQSMMGVFLPTMPQDDIDVIRQSFSPREGTIVFYRCPNGHPYAIGECGRPYTEGTCNVCGQKIGGQGHREADGNTKDTGADQTRPGHILGTAAERTNVFAGERRLEGAACAVLRFFTHAALMLGTETNPQAVAGLVYPPLQQDVGQFFWDHLQKDLEIIHLATGKSVDDVFLLLHFICHQISQSEAYRRYAAQRIETKSVRETWEDQFAKTFIRPPLQDLDHCLRECNDRIMKDKRIGQDKLMSILYEVEKSTSMQVESLQEFPAVWRYRSRITLEHFLREFNLRIENNKNRKTKMAVLCHFRKEHPHLQALHHIPNILRLQQFLMAKYRRRLDHSEAKDMTIATVAEEDNTSVDVMELLPDFAIAWDCVKESLHSYGCWTVHDGLIHLPDAYKNMVIDENSPLAVLLPSTQGPGICSYMLLEFLFRKHNDFMNKYCDITKSRYNRLPEVSVKKLHSNHLINYHPERDLLPIVLANCNYSFELGKGTTIEYDFEGFEYQLQETILQSKSRVEQKSHIIPIETMVYRADTANAVVFKTLRDSIAQESLAPAVRLQIMAELKSSLPDICDSINNLDITISFLKSLGGEPDKNLQTFMTDVLKMKQTVLSQKARQSCRFKHVQSLWLLLSFEKSVVLAQHSQDAFDNLDVELKAALPESARAELKQFCQNKSLDKLEYLLQQMFDCLLLRVAQPADPFDQDAVDMKPISLRDILVGDLDAPLYNKEPVETLTLDDIATLPEEILGKHIPDTWLTILRELTQRRKEMN